MTNEQDITPTTGETRPGETPSTQAEPTQAQPTGAQPTETHPTEAQPSTIHPSTTRPMTEFHSAERRPGEPRPGEPRPREPLAGERLPGAEAIDAAIRAKAEAEVDRRLLESSLVRLRASGHPLLRSMADDLLAGRVSMRELARTPGIAAPIQAAAQRYLRWRNSMSPDELQAISDDMAARVQWMRDQIAIGWKKRDSDQPAPQNRDGERGSHPEK